MKNSIFLHLKRAGFRWLFIFSKKELKMDQLKNSTTVPVVDRFGYLVEKQEYRNMPLVELYPDEQVILIQWTTEHDNTRPNV
jgi:hypothetical protein